MRKPTFCICENKGADQLHSNCEADLRLCFRFIVQLLSHLLIAGCDIGVQISVRPFVRAFVRSFVRSSVNIYVEVWFSRHQR